MDFQRRCTVALSRFAPIIIALAATGCAGVGETGQSGLGSSARCTTVRTGAWEFELSTGRQVFFSLVDGDLTQSGCFLSYDEDRIFQGSLSGATWNVSSPAGWRFSGTFSGSPATTFLGTFVDAENVPAGISGRYVGGGSAGTFGSTGAEVADDRSGQFADLCSQESADLELPSGVSRADARTTCFEWSNMTDVRFERLFNSAQGIHDEGCSATFYFSLPRCSSMTGGEVWEMACAACFVDIAAAVWN